MKQSTEVALSIRKLIEDDIKKSPHNTFVIARRYGLSKSVVADIAAQMRGPVSPLVSRPMTIKVDPEEIPERLRRYVVQVKAVNAPWVIDESLKTARREYDDGEVELMTGRLRRQHGDALVLYKVPRVRPDARRRPYFSAIYEG